MCQCHKGEVEVVRAAQDRDLTRPLIHRGPAVDPAGDEHAQLAGGDQAVAVARGLVAIGPATQALLEIVTEDRAPQLLVVTGDLPGALAERIRR